VGSNGVGLIVTLKYGTFFAEFEYFVSSWAEIAFLGKAENYDGF